MSKTVLRVSVWLSLAITLLTALDARPCSAQETKRRESSQREPRKVGDAKKGTNAKKNAAVQVGTAAKTPESSWASFRGPTGQGIATSKGLPLEWSDDKSITWKTELPGPGASSPVTWGDRIYVTCYTGYWIPGSNDGSLDDLERHLVAINATNGKILWDKPSKAVLPEEKSIRDHGFAASTPAIDEERIYTFYGKSGVIAYNHEGEQLWHADVGSATHGWGSAASPVLYGDMVIINASVESESLIALDRKDGKQRWAVDEIKEAWNTPIVARSSSGRVELIIATQGTIRSYRPEDGTLLWTCKTDITWYMVPSCVVADGVVYCIGGRSGVAGLAVKMDGNGDVTETHRLWKSNKGSNVSSPIVHEGHLYWVNDSREMAYCAKVETGEVVYERRMERAGQFYGSPILADGKLYYQTREGRVFVVAAKPEYEELARNDLSDRSTFNGSPAIWKDQLLIRSDKFLYSIGK